MDIILFEAGALSNRLDKAKVCPILFGIKKADIAGPLTTFQMTDFTKEDFFKLIQSINNSLDEPIIAENNIKEVFDAFFTKLEDNIKKVLQEGNQTDNPPKNNSRTERDILEEILLLVRRQERRINSLEEDKRVHNITSFSITDYLSNDFKKGDIVYNEKDGVGKVVNVHSDLIMVEFQKEEDIPTRKLLPRKLLQKL